MGRFEGKNVLVTGASRGIGLAIARRFASEGGNLAILSTRIEGSQAIAEELSGAYGVKVLPYACDVGDGAAVQDVVGNVIGDFSSVDILVNNAGITRDGLIMRMSESDWDDVIHVNLKGVFNFCKVLVRYMMKARAGRIINIASVAGICGNPGQTNYSASKAGIIGFTKSLAKEVASRSITVNAVAPGLVETDMSQAIPEAAKAALLNMIPMMRVGLPEEVAGAVAFLASDDARYITGHVLQVDGGLCM